MTTLPVRVPRHSIHRCQNGFTRFAGASFPDFLSRCTVLLVRTTGDDPRVMRPAAATPFASQGARIQTGRSSSVVRITCIALGWIGSTIAFDEVVEKP
jgi:hypothetical protein